jgi:hypothetical protein
VSDEETIQRGRLNEVTDKAATTGAKIAADVRAGLSNVVDGVKDKISGDSVRKIGEAAGKIRNYVDDRGVQGMSDDVTSVIRRYPVTAMLFGVVIGVLLARPRGE